MAYEMAGIGLRARQDIADVFELVSHGSFTSVSSVLEKQDLSKAHTHSDRKMFERFDKITPDQLSFDEFNRFLKDCSTLFMLYYSLSRLILPYRCGILST